MALTIIRAGQAVQIIWQLTQSWPLPPPPQLYDPPTLPNITIFDPNSTIQVNNLPTVRLSTGYYSYTYISSSTATLGIWTAWLNVIDADNVPSGSVDSIDAAKTIPVFQLV